MIILNSTSVRERNMLDSTWWSVLLLQGLVLVRAQRGTRNCMVDGVEMCQYESHREMINKLQSLQRQYPDIVKVSKFLSMSTPAS